jgi:ActR/RegA family two-component response regulator
MVGQAESASRPRSSVRIGATNYLTKPAVADQILAAFDGDR